MDVIREAMCGLMNGAGWMSCGFGGFQVPDAPESGFCHFGGTFHAARATFALGAEPVSCCFEEVVHEFPAADDRAVGEISDSESQDFRDGDIAGGFELFEFRVGECGIDAFFQGFFLHQALAVDGFR